MREVPLMPITAALIIAGTVIGVAVATHLKPTAVDAGEEYVEDFSVVAPRPVPQEVPAACPSAPKPQVASPKPQVASPKPAAASKPKPPEKKLAVFRGFEDKRYQRYDKLLLRLVAEFNAAKADWAGASAGQARSIRNLDPLLIKAQIIQESGGSSSRSRAAWMADPAQVNVPGDWSPYKKYLGLRKPRHRNEGTPEQNLKAAIMFLSRKGFGSSGQPAANRPSARFDKWSTALKRYNGRNDLTRSGRRYCDVYADRILTRAASPSRHVSIDGRK